MQIALEHMTAENGHEFDRCIDAFDHPRYEIIATGETYDGSSEVAFCSRRTNAHFQISTSTSGACGMVMTR